MHRESQDLRPIVEACLLAYETDGETGLAAEIARHPVHASALWRRIDALRSSGLLAEIAVAGHEAAPQKLGEFRLLERLGAGGMGVVHRAVQESLGREVALKVVRPEHLFFEGARERFRREVDAVARLQHPGIVAIHAVGEDRGVPYFAMELIQGRGLDEVVARLRHRGTGTLVGADLFECVRRGDPTSAGDLFQGSWATVCVRIVRRVAEALAHAHARGILHRDVKPSNVMVTTDGRVVLLDFGLAQAEGSHPLTRSGAQIGSLPYMAPEQVRGESVDARTDVYALGVTLHELLVLRCPFDGAAPESMRGAILGGDVPALREISRSVPRDLEVVCRTAMEVDPSRRYASATAFAEDLGRFLEHRTIVARPAGIWRRASRIARRHPVWSTVAASLPAVAVVTALVIGWYRTGFERALRAEIDGALDATLRLAQQASDPNLVKTPGFDDQRAAQLDDAVRRLSRMHEQHPDRADVRLAWLRALVSSADTWMALGRADAAQSVLLQAEQELRADGPPHQLASALSSLGHLRRMQGRIDEALASWIDALRLVEPRDGGEAAGVDQLSLVATLCSDIGMLARARNDPQEAERRLDQAMHWRKRLLTLRDDRAMRLADLRVRSNHATLLASQNRLREACDEQRSIVEDAESLCRAEPAEPEGRRELARARAGFARMAIAVGRVEEVTTALDAALAGFAALVTDFPQRTHYRVELGLAGFAAAEIAAQRRDADAEEAALRRAIASHTELLATGSRGVDTRRELSAMHDRLADLLRATSRGPEASAASDQAVTLMQEVVASGKADPRDRLDLGLSLYNRALLRRKNEDPGGVLADIRAALEQFDAVRGAGALALPDGVLSSAHRVLVETFVVLEDLDEAMRALVVMQQRAPMDAALLEGFGRATRLDRRDDFRALLQTTRGK
ncbi:MAG: serine/threonine-protein kinase [Planctomycetota bacterium]